MTAFYDLQNIINGDTTPAARRRRVVGEEKSSCCINGVHICSILYFIYLCLLQHVLSFSYGNGLLRLRILCLPQLLVYS